MKILITGISGFVASYVVPILLEQGHEIMGTSRSGLKSISSDWASKIKYQSFDFSFIDKEKNYFEYFEEPDVLIHLAWSGLPNYRSILQIEDNLMPHYFFVKNLVSNGLTNVNITGTCLEYGGYSGSLSEDLAPAPKLAYPIAKNALRIFLEELKKEIDFSLKWIRLFYVYGKGQNPKSLIPQLEKAIEREEEYFNTSGGEQLRDFIQIEKAANHIVNISVQQKVNGIINCCSGKPKSVRKLVEEKIKEKESDIKLNLGHYPYPTYEPMAFWGNNDKLKKIKINEKLS